MIEKPIIGTVPLARVEPHFRSVNFFQEWEEEEAEVQYVPKDDVLEGLKRKDQSAAIGEQLSFTFKDVILKTIGEYQSILDAKQYKDKDDRSRMLKTIKELKRQLQTFKEKKSPERTPK